MRKIIHLDMDCFFAAVEVKHNSDLLKKPIAVGGRADRRGVIATASYEARRFGVRSAMSTAHAQKLCPDLILVHPKFSLYKEESVKIREIFRRYTDTIEPLSLDEAYLDVTNSRMFDGSATLLAKKIRQDILFERGLTASAGIANNKFLAKVCSDLRKPNGQFTVPPNHNSSFTKDLPVKKIWGVGQKTSERMHKLGFKTCGDLRRIDLLETQRLFGSIGSHIYKLCRGEDDRPVKASSARKSFSVERTFPKDLKYKEEIKSNFEKVFSEFTQRFEKAALKNLKIEGIHFKIKTHDFQTKSKNIGTFKEIPDYQIVLRHFLDFWEATPTEIRLIGFGVKLDVDQTEQLEFVF